MRRMTVLVVGVALSVPAAGCGGDDGDGGSSSAESTGSADQQAYLDAIGEVLAAIGVPADQADCTAGVYIDVIGMEQLREATTPDEIRENANLASLGVELDDAAGDAFYAGMNECFDVREFFISFTSGGDTAVAGCLDQAINDDALQAAFVGGLLRGSQSLDPEVEAALADAYTQCAPEVPAP
jgi:hypothetical protein